MPSSPEHGEHLSDTEHFKKQLDHRFTQGEPHRHAPGMGLREEEIHLKGDTSLIAGQPPQRIRAIRPKPGDTTPLKPRPADFLEGHRLDMLQYSPDGYTVTEIYLKGEQIRQRVTYKEKTPAASWRVPDERSGVIQHMRFALPSPNDFREDIALEPEAVASLFQFLETASPIPSPES